MSSKNFKKIRINGFLYSQLSVGCEETGLNLPSLWSRIHRNSKIIDKLICELLMSIDARKCIDIRSEEGQILYKYLTEQITIINEEIEKAHELIIVSNKKAFKVKLIK